MIALDERNQRDWLRSTMAGEISTQPSWAKAGEAEIRCSAVTPKNSSLSSHVKIPSKDAASEKFPFGSCR